MRVATSWSTSVTLPESPHPSVAIEAALRYDSALPHAVRLAFPPMADRPEQEWVFGRDLLDEGRHRPAGEGDVTVAPGAHDDILLTLRGIGSRAVIRLPADVVTAFLRDSFALVPAGREHEHLDLDDLLDRLLR
ncbi:SsgA family sporulation/cell division regulator [Kitasatospora sp. NPDC049285]|uniref:SsgA family sporulation/cell division regulator n=1 Tax=Kitasatospora sp. NPDC049285 TaxID=3157096 RepID=UPI00341DD88F